jgi:putative membrane protein
MTFLTDAGERALDEAIVTIEAQSAAEVVVAIRPRARYSLIQHATVGLLAAIGMLAGTLYSPIEFTLWQILVLPIIVGLAGAGIVEAVPPLYRWLSPTWLRYEHVREAAYAAFVERGIHSTRDRTGILVYIALRERMVEIVADIGVTKHHGIEVLADWAGTLEARLPDGAEAFAKELAALGPALAATVPRRTDDVDELGNGVHVFGAPPHQRRGAAS